ncbi:threonine-phosphate decarboxylase CobD [Acetobacter cibinongensis]
MRGDGSQVWPEGQQAEQQQAVVPEASTTYSVPSPSRRMVPLPAHGGQVQAVMQYFPHAPQPVYDLSTGISPFVYPGRMPDLSCLTHLPEEHEEATLRRLAARAYGVADAAMVAAGAGSQSLIALLPTLLQAEQVCILGPTYSGHEQAWRLHTKFVTNVHTPQALAIAATQPGTVCVLCNPNNPDGRLLPADWVRRLADRCAEHGNSLVVDEAFADFEGQSVASALPHPALIVLRSFGKTYGLPGVRLGFLLAAPELVERVRAAMGSWPVSTVALVLGQQALADKAWHRMAAQQAGQAHERLVSVLEEAGLVCHGECRLFTLVVHPQAAQLWQHLCERGIVTRIFAHQPDHLRIGLPAEEGAWHRLSQALRCWQYTAVLQHKQDAG